jgi:hypothetical protein
VDVIATLDPSQRRWPPGSLEFLAVRLVRTDGELDDEDWTGIALGDYDDGPTTWATPVDVDHDPLVNALTGHLLIGATLRPTSRQWVWARVARDNEVVVRRCINGSIDFSDADWPAVGLLTSATLLTSPTLLTSASA